MLDMAPVWGWFIGFFVAGRNGAKRGDMDTFDRGEEVVAGEVPEFRIAESDNLVGYA